MWTHFQGVLTPLKGKDSLYKWLKGNIKVVPTQKKYVQMNQTIIVYYFKWA